MLRNGRAATSAMLMGLLIMQAACLRPLNPPAPLRPGDPGQQEAIESADRVKVWTLDEQDYFLVNASFAEQGLSGELWGEEIVPIPVDSITAVQVFNRDDKWLSWAVPLTAAVTAFVVAAIANSWFYIGCIGLCGSGT